MDISDLLAANGVVLRGGASSKRQALHAVAEAASHVLNIDDARIFEALMEREALGSTGLGSGVAVPHARLPGLDRMRGVFVRLDQPVEFESVDEQPVDLIFALFAPPNASSEHLRALARVSRMLRQGDLREHLRNARTPDAIHALLVQDEPSAAS